MQGREGDEGERITSGDDPLTADASEEILRILSREGDRHAVSRRPVLDRTDRGDAPLKAGQARDILFVPTLH